MKTDSTLENRLACAFVPMITGASWPTKDESDFPALHPPDVEYVKRKARRLAEAVLASCIGTLDLNRNPHTFDLVVRTVNVVLLMQYGYSEETIAETAFEYIKAAYELLTAPAE